MIETACANVRFAPLAGVGHGTHHLAELPPALSLPAILFVQFGGVVPANSFHVDVDVARGRRTVVVCTENLNPEVVTMKSAKDRI